MSDQRPIGPLRVEGPGPHYGRAHSTGGGAPAKFTRDTAALRDDLREILELLGLGTHARAASPHRVFQDEVIPAIRRLVRDAR